MVAPKDVYMCEIQQKASGTSDITLQSDKVPEGKVLEVTYIAIKDETTAAKTFKIGYMRGGEKFWLREEPAATGYHGIQETGVIYLAPNECVIAMIESPTDADITKLFVRGKYLE